MGSPVNQLTERDLSASEKPYAPSPQERYRKIYRESMEHYCGYVVRDAESITRYTRLLRSTPPFEVGHRETLDKARDAVLTALRTIDEAIAQHTAAGPNTAFWQAAE